MAKCQPGSLSLRLGARTGSASQQNTQVIDLTNTGSATCEMTGFPGVDLVGTENGGQAAIWSLTRQAVTYSRVTLTPGSTAHFNVIFLPANSASPVIDVQKLVITPPNDFTHAEVPWNVSVLLQDAATHPGTFISPVNYGA